MGIRYAGTSLKLAMLVVVAIALGGCLGGGGSSGSGAAATTDVTVTPALGRLVGAIVTVRKLDGSALGSATTGATSGTATIAIDAAYSGPLLVEVAGAAGASYFDEAAGVVVAFPAGEVMRALAATVQPDIGVTTLTEMAYQAARAAAGGDAALTAAMIQNANDAIRDAMAPELASGLLTPPTLVGSRADLAQLPTSAAGKYAARLAALAQAARTADSANASPALAMLQQLKADMADGKLDGRNADGTVAGSLNIPTASMAELLANALQTALAGNASLSAAMPQGASIDTSRLGATLAAAILGSGSNSSGGGTSGGNTSGGSTSGGSTSGGNTAGGGTSGGSTSGGSTSGGGASSSGTLVERPLPTGLSVVTGAASVSPAVYDGQKLYAFLWNFVSHSNYFYNVTSTTDGVTWSAPQVATGITNAAVIAAGNGVLVAATPVTDATNACTGMDIARSTDGVSWSAPTRKTMASCVGGSIGQMSIHDTSNGFVVVDKHDCTTLASTDGGQSWTAGQILASTTGAGGVNGQYACGAIFKSGNTLVAQHGIFTTKPASTWIYSLFYSTSSDGVSWTPHTVDLGAPVQNISSMFPTSQGFKVYSGTSVWTSTDLATWTKDAAPAATPWPSFYVGAPAVVGGKYYGIKSSQLVASVDGLSYDGTGLTLPAGVTLMQPNFLQQNIFYLPGASRIVVFGSKSQHPVAMTNN